MTEKQIVAMQKHIDDLNRENETIAQDYKDICKELVKKSKQFRITIGIFLTLISFLGLWIYALYYANGLLATDNQTKETWKQSAIELLKMNEDLRMENAYIKQGMKEALEKGFIQKMPPPMVKEV
jgi:regulator of replication initiation timing